MTTADDDAITIGVPATTGSLQILRLNAAAVAGMHDLDVDEIDDLKLAVEELAAWLVARPGLGARLTMTIEPSADGIRISAHRDGMANGSGLGEHVPVILAAIVDHHEIHSGGGRTGFVMEKHLRGG